MVPRREEEKAMRYLALYPLLGFALILLTVGMISAGLTDTILIDLNVTQEVSIDVSPNTTAWYGVSVGSTTTARAFVIYNVGSVNISTVDASITNAPSQPYGTGVSSNFDAGDFILVNSTNNATFYYINKVEYNESIPGYVTSPVDFTEGADTGYFGRMRTVPDGTDIGQEYLFFTNRTDTTGNCSNNGVLLLGNNPRSVSAQGDVNFSDSGNFTSITLTAADGFTTGVGDIPAGHTLHGYCVKVNADCGNVTFFHFNMVLDSGSDCGSDQYVYGSSNLQAGNFTEIWLEAKVPAGVSDGDLSQGTLTFTASQ
jgi:hypothetical protein